MSESFFRIKNNYFQYNDKFFYPVGVNYITSKHDCRMWREWEPDELDKDFSHMKNLGINVVRLFLFWQDLEPKPGEYNDEILDRFAKVVKIAKKNEIFLHPSILNGTLAAPGWHPIWSIGKSIYSEEMIEKATKIVKWIVKRFKNETQIFAWDLSNEPSAWEEPRDPEWSKNWVKSLLKAIKDVDGNHLVTVGLEQDNITGSSRFEFESTVSYQDFISMHTYPLLQAKGESVLDFRNTYFHAYAINFSQLGKPVLLQEFGLSTGDNSENEQGGFYEMVLYSSLINGAAGVLPWSWKDELRCDRHPYNQRFPMSRYGIIRLDDTEKLAVSKIKKFQKFISNFTNFSPYEKKVAILLPPNIYNYEVSKWVFNCFILAKMSGMNPCIIRDCGDNIFKYNVLILPNFFSHNYTVLNSLRNFIKKGGSIFCSLGPGYIPIKKLDDFCKEVLGIEFSSEISQIKDTEKITMLQSAPSLLKDLTFEYSLTSTLPYHPSLNINGIILANDSKNRPALILKEHENSLVLTSLLPIEYFLSNQPNIYEKGDMTYKIYEYLAELTGVKDSPRCQNPFVEIGMLKNKDRRVIVAINHLNQQISTNIEIDKREISLNFLPYEAKVIE